MAKRHHSSSSKHHNPHHDHDGHMMEHHKAMRSAHPTRVRHGGGDMAKYEHGKIAGMPSEVMIKVYPKTDGGFNMFPDDSITGMDQQIDESVSTMRHHEKPRKA